MTGSPDGPKGATVTAGPNSSPPTSRHRVVFIMTSLVGELVDVETTDGALYRGVFSSANLADTAPANLSVLLRMAHVVRNPHDRRQQPPPRSFLPSLLIPADNLASISARNVSLAGDTAPPPDAHNRTLRGIRADPSSPAPSPHPRQLQAFDDFAPTHTPATVDGALAASSAHQSTAKWDQFEANRASFGVRSTFDEEEYTTKLDRSAPNFSARQRAADRIAAEIEASAPTSNPHLADERSDALPAHLDEQAMYSSVARTRSASALERSSTAGLEQAPLPAADGQPSVQPLPQHAQSAPDQQPGKLSQPPPQQAQSLQSVQPQQAQHPPPPARTNSVESMPALESPKRGMGLVRMEARASHESLNHLERLRESKQVRKSLSGAASPRSGSRSPRHSSLVGDATAMAGLDLDRSTPKLSKEVVDMFEEFKIGVVQEQNVEALRKLKAEASNLVRSPSITFKDKKLHRIGADGSSASVSEAESDTSSKPEPASTSAAAAAEKPPAPKSDALPPLTDKPKKKLNPNAKPFALNVEATEFRPAPQTTPAQAAPAQAAGATPDARGVVPSPNFVTGAPSYGPVVYGSSMVPHQFVIQPNVVDHQFFVPMQQHFVPAQMGRGAPYPGGMYHRQQMPHMPMYPPQQNYYVVHGNMPAGRGANGMPPRGRPPRSNVASESQAASSRASAPQNLRQDGSQASQPELHDNGTAFIHHRP